jgi:hypothetical protein
MHAFVALREVGHFEVGTGAEYRVVAEVGEDQLELGELGERFGEVRGATRCAGRPADSLKSGTPRAWHQS